MTKYRQEIAAGEDAFEHGEPRSANPFAYLTTEWYAWDAGWGHAQRDENGGAEGAPCAGGFAEHD